VKATRTEFTHSEHENDVSKNSEELIPLAGPALDEDTLKPSRYASPRQIDSWCDQERRSLGLRQAHQVPGPGTRRRS